MSKSQSISKTNPRRQSSSKSSRRHSAKNQVVAKQPYPDTPQLFGALNNLTVTHMWRLSQAYQTATRNLYYALMCLDDKKAETRARGIGYVQEAYTDLNNAAHNTNWDIYFWMQKETKVKRRPLCRTCHKDATYKLYFLRPPRQDRPGEKPKWRFFDYGCAEHSKNLHGLDKSVKYRRVRFKRSTP